MVRQAMPSAWPRSRAPGFCSTMQVLMSGKADSWAAKVKPAGPQPTMRTSTSSGTAPDDPDAADRCARALQTTDEGRRTLCGIEPAVEAAQRIMLRGLTADEADALLRLLRKAIAAGNELSRAPLREAATDAAKKE